MGFHTFPRTAEGQLQNAPLAKSRRVSGLSRDVRKLKCWGGFCVWFYGKEKLGQALAGRNGYLPTHGADVLSHASGSDPMRNGVIDFFVLLDIWPEWDLKLLLQLLGCGCNCKELLIQICFWRLLTITKKINIKIKTFAVQRYIKSPKFNLST